tara:strand:+ start:534 stop:950 length:417 start_codon:yes stop_codon:yes gene_type:complete
MKITGVVAMSLTLIVGVYLFGVSNRSEKLSIGAVVRASEYTATTTYSKLGVPLFTTNQNIVSNSKGALGTVIITGAVAGSLRFMDATSTTDTASTTIVVFPASTAVGSYPFDSNFNRGLILESTSGLLPTTTITYRVY